MSIEPDGLDEVRRDDATPMPVHHKKHRPSYPEPIDEAGNGKLFWWIMGIVGVLITSGVVGAIKTAIDHGERLSRVETIVNDIKDEVHSFGVKADHILFRLDKLQGGK